jgi:ribosomal protein L29
MKKIEELKEIKKYDAKGLIKELDLSQEKLFELKRKKALDKLKNTSEIRKGKKRIARINSILRDKILEEIKVSDNKKEA